ncbi:YcaO-like family protein [Streptomyces sp. NPDC086783]|uniref:YcaO-like family protein n=1 Tax=Streptomyces sp. NPDC086783 TaxID=3365758 RepID=UPI0037F7F7A5
MKCRPSPASWVRLPDRWGIPCFAAFVWSEDFALLTAGSGAHSSASVALSRDNTEAVQSRLTLINGSPRRPHRHLFPRPARRYPTPSH